MHTISAPTAQPPRHRVPAILPEHAAYDEARQAWNLAADQRPAAVVIARSVAEVIGAVELAKQFGLKVAPQGTGHLAGAMPDLSDALLLRTDIGGVEVDPVARIARVGAGAVWQDVVDAVTPHGLAALSGSSHDVGVVGYTLGGGASWLARKHGLSANNVRAIEVVLADGRVVRATAEQHRDLFWALRGGGGNFGVVTHVELELFAISEVFAGMTVWPAAQAREVLTAWRDWTRTAPDEVTTSFRLVRAPADPELPEPLRDTPVVVIDGAVLGDAPEAVVAAFRGVGTPIMDTWGTMSPAGLLTIHMDPPHPVPGVGDTQSLEDLPDAAIDALLAVADPEVVSPLLVFELRQLGGALGRVPARAGARGHFDGRFIMFAVGIPMSLEVEAALHARLDELKTAARPFAAQTSYMNFLERGGDARQAFDEDTYARLGAIRGAVDPEELFLASHPIRTA